MSLFGGLHLGASSLNANRFAMEVLGNNIANSQTPGFVREVLDLAPIRPDKFGNLSLGRGVTSAGVFQQIDRFLFERARAATSESEAASARSTMLQRVETVFNELTEQDISTLFNEFFNSIQDVQNRPDDPALRSVVVERGALLAETVRTVRGHIDDIRSDISHEVSVSVEQINEAVREVRKLNFEIIAAESGGGEAGSLRTLRDQQVAKISKLIEIRAIPQESGAINIFVGNDFLLFDGAIQEVAAVDSVDRGQQISTLVMARSNFPVPTSGGRLGGIQQARDEDIAAVLDRFDDLIGTLIFEFNKQHSSGQGLGRFTALEGTYSVLDSTAALDTAAAGLVFTPNNGSFELRLSDPATGQTTTSVIDVDLDGTAGGDSLADLVAKIDAAFIATYGVGAASVTPQGRLQIQAPAGAEFSFANDTSGVLAALGVNTFFTGQDSRDIDVNSVLRSDPTLFAAAANGEPADTTNAVALASLHDRAFDSLGGLSITQAAVELVGNLASTSDRVRMGADILEGTEQALVSENLAITGVSIDEEVVKLMTFQRSFQASARYISTINEMLDEVINLGR